MKKVYFISGLGADKRVFSLLDLSFCEPIFVDWIKPLKKEPLSSYAIRLRALIPESNPTIVGISLGGMLVTEMAKSDKNISGIIISSNKTKSEFPKHLLFAKFFPIYKWLPSKISKKIILNLKWFLGANGKDQKKLIRQIILDTDMVFAKWAINAILHWNNKEAPNNILHIHGTADRLLPYRFVKANYTIKGGSHLMTMNKSKEVSDVLKILLS